MQVINFFNVGPSSWHLLVFIIIVFSFINIELHTINYNWIISIKYVFIAASVSAFLLLFLIKTPKPRSVRSHWVGVGFASAISISKYLGFRQRTSRTSDGCFRLLDHQGAPLKKCKSFIFWALVNVFFNILRKVSR